MKKKTKQILGVVVLLAVVAFLFFSANKGATQEQAMLTYRAIINFKDGTSAVYPATGTSAQFNSLGILDVNQNREVSSVTVELYITPTFTGTVSSWVCTTSAQVQVYDATNNVKVYQSSSDTITATGTSLSSGQSRLIKSSTISADTLEGMYNYQTDRNYYYTMALTSPVSVTLNFASGSPSSLTLQQSSTSGFYWTFKKTASNTFTNLAVAWNIGGV